MNFSLYLLLGPLIAFAVNRRNGKADDLGCWRPFAGLIGALFPFLDIIFVMLGPVWAARLERGPFWSPFFWPVWGVLLALLLAQLSGKAWHRFASITLVAMGATILTGLFTAQGIALFAPLFTWRLKLPLIFTFDWILFLILFVGLGVTLVVQPFRRDLARLTLLVAVGYFIVLGTFLAKAADFSHLYARSLNLDLERSYVLPQPMSPFNWRLIHITSDGKIHDTRVNLFLDEPIDVPDDAKRSWRLRELYQPLDQAVWRIYSRFGRNLGHGDEEFVMQSWHALEASPFHWQTRFFVFRQLVQFSNTRCVKWQDIRRIGAKKKWLDVYLTCLGSDGYRLYQASGPDAYQLVMKLN